MATTTIDEKQAPHIQSEHIERHSSDNELHKISTLGIDIENRDAAKGDDSDGRIDWTRKQVLATISLSGLYVGMASNYHV